MHERRHGPAERDGERARRIARAGDVAVDEAAQVVLQSDLLVPAVVQRHRNRRGLLEVAVLERQHVRALRDAVARAD